MKNQLGNAICIPVKKDTPSINTAKITELLGELDGWNVDLEHDEPRLFKQYRFKNFREAMAFSVQIAEIADQQDHHPSILVEWGKVSIWWWTHAIHGLHQNDFIMAAKTDLLYQAFNKNIP